MGTGTDLKKKVLSRAGVRVYGDDVHDEATEASIARIIDRLVTKRGKGFDEAWAVGGELLNLKQLMQHRALRKRINTDVGMPISAINARLRVYQRLAHYVSSGELSLANLRKIGLDKLNVVCRSSAFDEGLLIDEKTLWIRLPFKARTQIVSLHLIPMANLKAMLKPSLSFDEEERLAVAAVERAKRNLTRKQSALRALRSGTQVAV